MEHNIVFGYPGYTKLWIKLLETDLINLSIIYISLNLLLFIGTCGCLKFTMKNCLVWCFELLEGLAVFVNTFSICASDLQMICRFVFLIFNICWQKCENKVLQLKRCLAFFWKTLVSCDRYVVLKAPVWWMTEACPLESIVFLSAEALTADDRWELDVS